MTETILQVEHLRKEFSRGRNKVTAVQDVSFTVGRGEALGIVGESGSGKSTIVQMVTGLLEKTGGKVVLQGEDITSLKGKALRNAYRKMQMVFQLPAESFDPRRTLGDGIGESLRNAGMSKADTRKKVEELLVTCGLSAEFAERYPHEVSGGQCQRAAIARALAVDPVLLICDEATSALDVTVQKQIMELLLELKMKKRLAVLFICHDLALVQFFCDRVLVLHEGKMMEMGTPDEIIHHPKTEYTKKLIDSVL